MKILDFLTYYQSSISNIQHPTSNIQHSSKFVNSARINVRFTTQKSQFTNHNFLYNLFQKTSILWLIFEVTTIQILIKKAQKGDKRAFQELVKLHDSQVFSLIMRYTNDKDVAHDIYQEVFMNVYKNIGSFSFKSEFFTWLYRITVNTSLSFIKKEKRHRHSDEEIESTLEYSYSQDDSMFMYDLINEAHKLPEKQKMVFFLRFQNDLKINEIADIMNVDPGTVKGYLSRSIKKIKTSLKIV